MAASSNLLQHEVPLKPLRMRAKILMNSIVAVIFMSFADTARAGIKVPEI